MLQLLHRQEAEELLKMVLYYTYLKYIAFAIVAISLPVIALLILKVFQKLTVGRCKSLVCLTGKTAIITGGSAGIGFETALVLASRGCRVIIADKENGEKAKKKIIERTNNTNIEFKHLDLTSLQSIRDFAKEINATEDRLDILVNNAGVGVNGNKHTEDGLHATMQINHFGPFLLTHLLVDLLKKSAPSRIIFVSSATAFINNLTRSNLNYPKDHPLSLIRLAFIYGNSKLCNIITANGFAERLREYGITSNSLHPGLVNTDFYMKLGVSLRFKSIAKLLRRTVLFIYGKTPEEGAQTTVHLALSNRLKNVTGKHFWDCRMFPTPPGAWSRKFCREIWEESEKYVDLKDDEKIKLPEDREKVKSI